MSTFLTFPPRAARVERTISIVMIDLTDDIMEWYSSSVPLGDADATFQFHHLPVLLVMDRLWQFRKYGYYREPFIDTHDMHATLLLLLRRRRQRDDGKSYVCSRL